MHSTQIPGNLAEEFRIPAPKHTPGPWRAFDVPQGVGVTAASADVAHCDGFDCERPLHEEQANAYLIAQAPTMLADLTAAAAQLRKLGGEVNAALAARFEATIAAAVGGAE